MVSSLFQEQRELINGFFEKVDLDKTEKLVQMLFECQGTIILSGVGKSGFIANKLAMTLISIGKRALFLSPENALHGDIGVVNKDDLLIMISKSGETKELINLLPFIKNRNAKIIALVSQEGSTIAKRADVAIYLPIEKELCPFNLAPTTSPAVQLIYGDILAVALMKKMQFSSKDFAINHPAGAIGKKTTLCVEDVMIHLQDSPLCSKEDPLLDVLHTITSKKCGSLIVVDKEMKLEGIFTDGDLRRAIEKEPKKFLERTINDFMNPNPKWITSKELAYDALKYMEEDPKKLITILPVVNENQQVIGVLRMHDILQEGIK